MAIFGTAMFVGTAKFLAKWLVKRYLSEEPWAEAVASELGGELGKRAKSSLVDLLDAHFVSVARTFNPEFDNKAINRIAVDKEVELALEAGLKSSLLADEALRQAKVLEGVRSARKPVGLSEAESALYDVVLAEAVKVACDAAPGSPKFRGEVDKRLLDRSKQVIEGMGALEALVVGIAKGLSASTKEIKEVRTAVAELTARASDTEFEHRYCDALIAELDEVRLFGIDDRVRPEARRQKLSIAYLSLNLTSEDGTSAPMSFESLVADMKPVKKPFLLIRGEAGGGKSTLMKHLAISNARAVGRYGRPLLLSTNFDTLYPTSLTSIRIQGRSWRDQSPLPLMGDVVVGKSSFTYEWLSYTHHISPRVPLFIPLRRCRNHRLPPLTELTSLAADGLPEAPKEWIQRVIEEGRVIFLIDGLDEVAPKHRKDIDAGLGSWFKQYAPKGNLFVVTSRPLVKDPVWVDDFNFVEARVAPMSRPAREEFIDAWHKAVAEALRKSQGPGAETDAATFPAKAEALKMKLRQRHTVARVASNPLMCAMVCALSTEVDYDVDRSPRKIIEMLCNVLVHEREQATPDLDTEQFPDCYRNLTPDQRVEILARLAFEMVTSEMSVAGFDVLQKHAKDMLSGGILGAGPKDAALLAETLMERSGLLVKPKRLNVDAETVPLAPPKRRGRPDVDWIHATFKEFLAAGQMSESHISFLANNWSRPDVRNVCVHLVARVGTYEIKKQLLVRILGEQERTKAVSATGGKKPGKNELNQQRLREFLALRIQDAASSPDAGPVKAVERIRRRLLPPTSLAAAEALADLKDEILPELLWKEEFRNKPRVQQACVRALRLIDIDDAKEAMKTYAAHASDMGVIGELAEGMNPLEIPVVLSRVTSTSAVGTVSNEEDWLPESLRKRIKDIGLLARSTALQMLDLRSTGVVDLSPLAGLTALHSLSIGSTGVTDLSPLARLTALQSLDLMDTSVTDMSPLAELTALQALYLMNTRVTDLDSLAGLTVLQSLYLGHTGVTDLGPLARLTALRSLYLRGERVTHLGALAGLTALESLTLSSTGVTDLGPLAGLTALQSLTLINTGVTDLGPLESCSRLKYLYVPTQLKKTADDLLAKIRRANKKDDTGT